MKARRVHAPGNTKIFKLPQRAHPTPLDQVYEWKEKLEMKSDGKKKRKKKMQVMGESEKSVCSRQHQ